VNVLGYVAIQSIAAYVGLFALTRVLGKRQIAQLTFFDYIVGITIGSMAAAWSLNEVSTARALLALAIWGVLAVILAWVEKKSYWGRKFLDGKPVPLVEQGKLLEANLKQVRMSVDELMVLLREKGIFNLSDVNEAVFETNGKVSTMKKPELQPVTRNDLGIQSAPESAPKFLVISGEVVSPNLKQMGRDRQWLETELEKQGIADISSVFVAQMDAKGQLYIDKYNDMAVQPMPQDKPLLLASLKKSVADLETFAMQTGRGEVKAEYQQLARELEDVVRRMTPYLKGQ